jgi:pyruvate carboxylase
MSFGTTGEKVREYYAPFTRQPKTGSCEVYLHEMPGGPVHQLKEQAASMGVSPSLARDCAHLCGGEPAFGDIVKVTPSSKVVGDMALFFSAAAIKTEDERQSRAGTVGFPESVVDMMSGGLGWPAGGFPGSRHARGARREEVQGSPGGVREKRIATRLRPSISRNCARNSPTSSSARCRTTTFTRT